MKKPIIAGNWKMNNTIADTKALITDLAPLVKDATCDVVICTPYTDLATAVEMTKGTNIKVGAENVHWAEKGAFTGEISAKMLVELGVEYVIIGHSERRQYFGETDQTVNARAKGALAAGLKPIICVGETLEERESGKVEEVLVRQTKGAFDGIDKDQLDNIVIAYEPVWAIGTDKTATEKDIRKNPALMDALIGIYERNVQEYPATAILPYSQALSRFPAHLQQLDMESNGKSVNRDGGKIDYVTGPVIFGEPGTNGQHSFYQLLHQGTDITPLQFIAFSENQTGKDVVIEGSTSQTKLCANVVAQIVAFACGKKDSDPNKSFAGNRPSSLIYGKQLTPKTLGALLAHFENKVMFQGFVWNINSFDQEGVQLGKKLAKAVLSNNMEAALKKYAGLLIK